MSSNESLLYRQLSATRYTQVENFNCPVCLQLTLPPIKLICENHHLVCNYCLPHLKHCPLCRQHIKSKRCFELEYILQRLLIQCKPHELCKYTKYGCSFVHESGIDLTELWKHEKNCLYRVVKMAADLNSWYDLNYTRSVTNSWKLL